MRRFLLIPVLFLLSLAAYGQASGQTSVQAVVQDSSGHLYVNCTWSVVFVGENTSPGVGPYAPAAYLNSQQGQCDSSGNLGGIAGIYLADNINTVTPTPSQWSFSICSATGYIAGPYCATNILITITGVSQNITTLLTAALPLLPASGGGTLVLPNPANFPGPVSTPGPLTVGPSTPPGISAILFNGPDAFGMSNNLGLDQLTDITDPATGFSALAFDPTNTVNQRIFTTLFQSVGYTDGQFPCFNGTGNYAGYFNMCPSVGFNSQTGQMNYFPLQGADYVSNTSGPVPVLKAINVGEYCASGFAYLIGSCLSGGTMQQAIEAAMAANSSATSVQDFDARMFTGVQLFSNAGTGATPLTFYAGGVDGTSVSARLWLGNVSIGCDGPSAGYYTDGVSSTVGTPCLLLPSGFQLITAGHQGAGAGTTFFLCKGANSPSGTGCTTAFPQRTCPISSITGSGTSYTVNVGTCTGMNGSTLVATGGPAAGQNIWVGELAQTVTGTALSSLTRRVQTVPSGTSVTIAAESANAPTCASNCGNVYFYTAMIAPGVGPTSGATTCTNQGASSGPCPYVPLQTAAGVQSFSQAWTGGAILNTESYYGAVGFQNVNCGEGCYSDNVWCSLVVTACMDLREGSTDSGPWSNIRVIPSATTNVVASTIGIFTGNPTKGITGADIILAYSGTANQPWAAIQADGSGFATANLTISNCHSEYAYSMIEVVPNNSANGIEINNCLGPPSGGHAGVVGIRVLADGTLCKSCLFLNTTSQSGGYTDTILDDTNALTCTDLSLATYETNMNGFPSRTNCIAGTAAPIVVALTANYNSGSAYTLFTPLSPGSATICTTEVSTNVPTGATLPSLTLGWTDPTSTAKTVTLLSSTSTSAKSVYATNGVNASNTAAAGSCAKILTNGSTPVTITSASYAAGSGTALGYDLVVTWSIP